ncbi:MAG: flavin reductase [Betaproteobacteria bacterium]|nr:flavin reductase family protein [Pseudomonadota bacterium]NBO03513.1 flavin reductase [Betaproteobacteria bacterium]HAB47183.1 nitrilotriacetate monooxygenase [Lautropia sp.]NBO94259.1 flavin reductase [Betaproteobacteria bacterium]NBQ77911.1 flavin reductase [Betaproteobacteria bacterium]
MSGPDHSVFRHALAQFPTGVTVITGQSSTRQVPVGLTVSSFNSVSLSPPLVLWSLSNQSQHLDAFACGQAHRIHVLAHDQEALAKRFAKSGSDKFAGLHALCDRAIDPKDPASSRQDHAPSDDGLSFGAIPLLSGCSARFDCVTENRHQAGDHCIIVARVLFFETNDREPLVFAKGGFFALAKT